MKDLADLPVVLASSSPRRHQLLELIGVAHDVQPADVDETYTPGEMPDYYAERLARAKAELVAVANRESVVVGADTIVVAHGKVLGKPRDEADATRMLKMLSDHSHIVMTAVAVAHEANIVSTVEKVSVTFRDLSDEEIASYIATGEPMDKAGAYGIQGYGATIVRRIDGDYFAVMGLSLIRLVELFAQLGIRYAFGKSS